MLLTFVDSLFLKNCTSDLNFGIWRNPKKDENSKEDIKFTVAETMAKAGEQKKDIEDLKELIKNKS